MARFLVGNWRRRLWRLAILAIILGLGLIANRPTAYAGSYSGWFTGYAMGNRYGGAGVEIRQTHFANHYYEWCPNDPAAWWGWGTRITTSPPIAMHDAYGRQISYSRFYLYDVGDPSCSQGNYWVDIYFGRFKPDFDPCDCPRSPSPGYCKPGAWNSCWDAITFGRQWRSYTGP